MTTGKKTPQVRTQSPCNKINDISYEKKKIEHKGPLSETLPLYTRLQIVPQENTLFEQSSTHSDLTRIPLRIRYDKITSEGD